MDIVILTKNWVWRNPLYALIIRYAEFLPADGGYEQTLPRLRDIVARGYSVMIFPEGTRTLDGNLGRFHKGAFALAEELGIPVLPIYIHGAYHVWPKTEGLITEGTITVAIGERCHSDSHAMRHQFQTILNLMTERLETPAYRARTAYYAHIYKGRDIWKEWKTKCSNHV